MTALFTYRRTGYQEFHGNVKEITFKMVGNVTRLTLHFENGTQMTIKPEDGINVQVNE